MTNIAVYGTLRNGQGNHGLLGGSLMIGKGVTTERYRMFSTGGFPICVPDTVGTGITVEVYSVDDTVLSNVDRLEGYPSWYSRTQVQVVTPTGIHTAWMYYMDVVRDAMPEVYSGDWLDRYDYR